VTILLILATLAAQDSDAAKKARADFQKVDADIRTLFDLRQKLSRIDESFRNGSADPEALRKLAAERQETVQKFQELRGGAIQAMDALLGSLNEEVKRSPDDLGLLEVRAEANLLYDRKVEALADFEKVARTKAEDLDFALKLGRLQHALNRYDAAAGNLERYLRKEPAHLESRSLLALSYFSVHRFSEASELFDGLLKEKLDPEQEQRAQQFRKMAGSYVDLWKTEQEIRGKETKAADLPHVLLTTSRGEVELELFENEAPNTVANFVELVEKKFYDGLKFHRVIPGFMAQGGCPKGDGTGDPGYRFKDELGASARRHFRGSLSMANSGPDTNGSQFFLTHLPTEWLNGRHTVCGRVVRGQEVVDVLQIGDRLVKAAVTRKRDHEYKVERLK
jgi:cyclophilin family peptidyl-prolyl cis-trans isomerase